MKSQIKMQVLDKLEELFLISKDLFEHPELGFEEVHAEQLLTDYFASNGFTVEHGIYGFDTAFRATYDSGKEGGVIAYLCEYDALPEVGHGCGHNLIAAMSMGAAIGLKSVLDQIGGKIIVYGTPAEETSGVKGVFADQGAFDGLTVAMMAHPSPAYEDSGSSLALNAYRFQYFGKTAHAAFQPELGINALDSVIQLFNGVNALRQHVKSDVRIHGIISKGGVAPNIVPDFAEALFYIRAEQKEYLEEVVAKVLEVASGAARMTGATLKYDKFENAYDNMKTNQVLSSLFHDHLLDLGVTEIRPAGKGMGSIDMGNVSYSVPAIHPWVGVGDETKILHSREFAQHTLSQLSKDTLLTGATALALTGFQVLASKELQEKIWAEFQATQS